MAFSSLAPFSPPGWSSRTSSTLVLATSSVPSPSLWTMSKSTVIPASPNRERNKELAGPGTLPWSSLGYETGQTLQWLELWIPNMLDT